MTSVEMLWEAADAATALRDRFGHRDPVEASAWLATVLAADYGISMGSCERIMMSDSNALAWVTTDDGSRLIAKWSVKPSRFAHLSHVAALTNWLGSEGVPVSAPVHTCRGHLQLERDGISLGLQRAIGGDLLDTDDPHLTREAGAILARLHFHLRRYPQAADFQHTTPDRPLRAQILAWLDSHPDHVDSSVADALRQLVDHAEELPADQQLVHGDYRSANILADGTSVVGILDFEECRWDHPVVELARQAVLIGTRYHDWGPVSHTTHDQLRAGYESERPLTPAEASWWPALLLWHTLLMTPPGADPTGWHLSATQQVAALAVPGRSQGF